MIVHTTGATLAALLWPSCGLFPPLQLVEVDDIVVVARKIMEHWRCCCSGCCSDSS